MSSPADRLVTPVVKRELRSAEIPQMFGGSAPEARRPLRPVKGARQEAMEEDEDGLLAGDDAAVEEQEMDIEDIQAILTAELDDAIEYIDGDVADFRAKALRYYKGDISDDVPDEEGRSKAVQRVQHDVVMQVLPALVKIFMSAERVLRYMPNKADAEEEAEQRTAIVHHIMFVENEGFLVLWEAFKDALNLRSGILTWGMDERREVMRETYYGLTQQALMELLDDEEVTDSAVAQDGEVEIPIDQIDQIGMTEMGPGVPVPNGDAPQAPPAAPPLTAPSATITVPTYTVSIRRERVRNQPVVYAVPGEEFIRSRSARTLEDSPIVGRRRLMTRSDLVAMGIPGDWIDQYSGMEGEIGFYENAELSEREPDKDQRVAEYNEDLARTLYTESYIRIDRDGDGIAELLKIPSVGWSHMIWEDGIEDAVDIPFAILCPNPEPHQFEGEGICDDTMDAQRIMSMILRSTLDSLALSIHPRTVANPNKVNIADVLNTEIGAVIRADDVNQVRQDVTPFVGRDGLVMLDHWQQIVQNRTGVLAPPDPENLQSTTRKAVDLSERQATQRIELIARILAETGLKRLFRGIQRMLMRYQDVAKIVRLRGKYVEVDPRTWNSEMDVTLAIGLNMGTIEERAAFLKEVLLEQKALIETLGMDNPLVDLPRYRNVLGKLCELAGYADTDQFFKELPPNWQPPPPQPPPESDQVQAAKILAASTAETEKLRAELEREKMAVERMKIAADFNAKIAVAEIKEGIDRDNAALHAEVQQMIARLRADIEVMKTGISAGMKMGEQAAQPPAGGTA